MSAVASLELFPGDVQVPQFNSKRRTRQVSGTYCTRKGDHKTVSGATVREKITLGGRAFTPDYVIVTLPVLFRFR